MTRKKSEVVRIPVAGKGGGTPPEAPEESPSGAEAAGKAAREKTTRSTRPRPVLAQDTVERAFKAEVDLLESYREAFRMARENTEALFRAGNAVVRGLEAAGKEYLSFAQDAISAGLETGRAAARCRSLPQLVKVQASFWHERLDRALAQNRRMADLSIRIANDALAPLRPPFVPPGESGKRRKAA